MLYSKDIAIFSVSELTRSIRSLLESQFRFVHIRGEVSNLRIPYSGHMYFTLKDSGAQIRAVLFKGQRKYLADEIKEGQSIICHGRISIYEPRGEYQIIVDTVDFKGIGTLQAKFEALKRQLANEGLFTEDIKKTIPSFPEEIAIVTSPTGAAVYDFLKITNTRRYWGKITIFPVTVQGKNAADEIAETINTINDSHGTDIIVLIRGGGSLEDLWSFNEEKVARAIYHSSIPVVTGIGHETDGTIADLCADLQTHTPTAASQAIIPDGQLLLDAVITYRMALASEMTQRIGDNEAYVGQLRRIIGDLELYLSNHSLKLDYQVSAIINAMSRRISNISEKIQGITDRVHRHAPLVNISMREQHVEHLRKNICQKISLILERKQSLLGKQAALMESVNPLSILARGYSVASRVDHDTGVRKILTESEQVQKDDIVEVRLHQGELICQVKDKK